jgi:hypothetical protein
MEIENIMRDTLSSRADSLFTFRTAFSVVVSALETLKNDKDEKAGLYPTAILKFDFIVVLVVAEHILSSTVALTNYLQKPEIDLVEAVTEAKIVVSRLSDERNDDQVWDALYTRACDIASEFDIEPCTPRVVGRQRNRAITLPKFRKTIGASRSTWSSLTIWYRRYQIG